MDAGPLRGHIYVLDLKHPDLKVMLSSKPASQFKTSTRWIRPSARFVRARCRGPHPTDRRMFMFDIEEGTPGQFSLKSDLPDTKFHATYGLSPRVEGVIPGFLVLQGDSPGIH